MRSFISAVFLAALLLVAAEAPADTKVPSLFLEVDDNISPNDPAVPRTVTVVAWWERNGLPYLYLKDWELDWGDGTTVSETAPYGEAKRTYVHTYTTPGPKRIQLKSTDPNNATVYTRTEYTLLGVPQVFDPGLTVKDASAFDTVTATAQIKRFPPGIDYIQLIPADGAVGGFFFTPDGLVSTRVFPDPGVYILEYERNLFWLEDRVIVLPKNRVIVQVMERKWFQPLTEYPWENNPVGSCNTLNYTEWNPRICDYPSESLFFLTDRAVTFNQIMYARIPGNSLEERYEIVGEVPVQLDPLELIKSFELTKAGGKMIVQVEDKNGHNKLYAYTRAITGIDQFIYTGRQLLTADPIEPYMISPPVLDGLSFLSNDLLQLMVPTTNYHSYDETYYSYTRHNTRPNQYIKDKNPGVYADRNPRLDWKTHRMRAWRYNGQVFMAGNTETRHSVYQLHDLAGVQERYRAGDRLGGVESDLDLGAIGTNHFGLRIFYGSRKNITGSKHDLHILALGFPPAPPVEYPKYTADHLSAECITGNANVLDQNHDGIVDAADYRYLFAPQFY